jgi:CDP-paratose 2-epimerase
MAAQVAVTTSLVDPRHDFDVNVRGTLNLLEALRRRSEPVPLIFASTNKVYGDLADVALDKTNDAYVPRDPAIRATGIGEDRPLDFHTPYGCSKGAADQYVLDYARTFGIPAVVFRMSCIYGPHQFGNEDQGWVAHFLIRTLEGEPITIYGDGKQVRDVLFVEDLVDAMELVTADPAHVGEAFNIGGGAGRCISLLELIELIGELSGDEPEIDFEPWRPGDQRYYVSDTSRFRAATGWRPRVDPAEGVERLYRWLSQNRVGTRVAA